MIPPVNQCCRCAFVLLSHLSMITVHSSLSRDTRQHAATHDVRPTTLHNTVDCPSSSSSQPCTCSVDLVVRCQGQRVTEFPQFQPEVDRIFAELNLAGANVGKLLPDYFLGLRVRRVVLTGNQLSDGLGDTVFSSLGHHLTSLMLGACAIRTLPPRLLRDLPHLKVLHLWSNVIDVIPDSFFVANSKLRELSFWGNRLQGVHNRTFFGLDRLQILDLDRNRISAIERGALGHVTNSLQVLRLSSNHISALSDSIFTDARRLRVLTLASNRLRFIDARIFAGLRQLQTLYLANNHIQFLADGAFRHLVQLRTLDLSGNRLSRVWAGTFVGLRALTLLDLSRNRLVRLPEAMLSQSPALRRLILEDNWLSTVERQPYTLDHYGTLLLPHYPFCTLFTPLFSSTVRIWTYTSAPEQQRRTVDSAVNHRNEEDYRDRQTDRQTDTDTHTDRDRETSAPEEVETSRRHTRQTTKKKL